MKALILDVDWAPDFVIEDVVQILESHRVKATWFITHESPVLARLKLMNNLFELGIHPNFLPGSSHGNTQEEIIDHCLSILPNANSMRSHAYAQSSLLYKYVSENTNLNIDASIFAPHTPNLQVIKYFVGNRQIDRIPVYWEDSNEMKMPNVGWDFGKLPLQEKGLQIFAFHPIHIYLNTPGMAHYRDKMADIPDLQNVTPTVLSAKKQEAKMGARNFFNEFVRSLSHEKELFTLSELVQKS